MSTTNNVAPPGDTPPIRHWRCPKGHEQSDHEEFSFRLSDSTGRLVHDTGPMCYRCVFDFVCGGYADREYDEGGPNWYGAVFTFMTEHFETRRVKAPDADPPVQ